MSICPFCPNQVAKYSYSETIYQNALILKLDFLKIEFQRKTRFNENRVTCKMLHETQVPCIYIYIYIYLFIYLFSFLPITRFSKNRVFHLNLIFRKSNLKHEHMAKSFQNMSILLFILGENDKCPFCPYKLT